MLIAQQSSIVIKDIINSKSKEKISPKTSCKTSRSKILPTNNLKDKKDAPIISFGTRIQPKPTHTDESRKKFPSIKGNTRAKKKCDVTDVDLATSKQKPINKHLSTKKKSVTEGMSSAVSQQVSTKESSINRNDNVKPLKFNVNKKKKLNEMHKRFKTEVFFMQTINLFYLKLVKYFNVFECKLGFV